MMMGKIILLTPQVKLGLNLSSMNDKFFLINFHVMKFLVFSSVMRCAILIHHK